MWFTHAKAILISNLLRPSLYILIINYSFLIIHRVHHLRYNILIIHS